MSSPDHFYLRGSVFWFRAIIPRHLRHAFNGKVEVRTSLHTSSKTIARQRARALKVELDRILENVEQQMGKKKKDATYEARYIGFTLPNGTKIEIDHGDPDQERATAQAVIASSAQLPAAPANSPHAS